jgi:hypothetical protein
VGLEGDFVRYRVGTSVGSLVADGFVAIVAGNLGVGNGVGVLVPLAEWGVLGSDDGESLVIREPLMSFGERTADPGAVADVLGAGVTVGTSLADRYSGIFAISEALISVSSALGDRDGISLVTDPTICAGVSTAESRVGAATEGENEGNEATGIIASPLVELVVGSCVDVGLGVEGLVGGHEGTTGSNIEGCNVVPV